MENTFENLMNALEEYGSRVVDMYKDRLITDDKKASGNLIDSVECNIAYKGLSFSVTLQLADYWRYVEKGRKPGKFPPVNKIREWIRIKPVIPRPMANGKLPTENQLSFLISRKIANEGIPAGNQLKETLETVNGQYLKILQEAIQKDFDIYAMKVYDDIGKMIRI